MGLGSKRSSKILGCVTHTVIWGFLKKEGVAVILPPEGRWIVKEPESWWGDSAAEWMEGYDTKFPDWSVIWWNDVSRRISNTKYRSMSQLERKQWNKKAWQGKDKTNAKRYMRDWKREKRKSDPAWRIAQAMRSRLSGIMKGANMGGMRGFIGCDIGQLRRHLESGFTKRMSWDNYGTYWHVDHVLPVASFNHGNRKQINQCWHWSNLAPLEAGANLEKSDRITKPQMQLLLECHA